MAARTSILLVLIFAVAAACLLWMDPKLPPQRALRQSEEAWQLAERPATDVDEAVSIITGSRLWGAGPVVAGAAPPLPVEEPALTPPDWRIAGVFSLGGSSVALLAIDGRPQQELRVGDKLPGGAKILAITPDRICILLGGKKRSISTYRE